MVTLKIIICGQEVLRDADTNNVSIINIYEGFAAQGFPLLLPSFSLLTVLEREAGDARNHAGRFEVRLGETVLIGGNMAVDFEEQSRARQMVKVAGLVITAPGIVSSRFFIGDQLLGEYRFEVARAAGPIAQVIGAPAQNQPVVNH